MKNKFSSTQYVEIVKRNGEYCKICGISSNEQQLGIASKTNSNKAPIEDQFLICSTCRSKRQLYQLCVRESEKIQDKESYVTELQVSRRKEPRFRLYVLQRLSETKCVQLGEHDLVNSAAEELGLSPTTVRRYIDKMCSSAGVLTRIGYGEEVYIKFSLNKEDFIE